jgi:hypothetical protein
MLLITRPANAQVTTLYQGYSSVTLATPANLPLNNFGGLVFKLGDPSTLLLVDDAEASPSIVYALKVVRGTGNHITGFSSFSQFASLSEADGGLSYAPNGDLMYGDYSSDIGEVYPGSSNYNFLDDLTDFNIGNSLSAINYVPQGIPGAGQAKVSDYGTGDFSTVTFSLSGQKYTATAAALNSVLTTNDGDPENFVWVAAGNPGFSAPELLDNIYQSGGGQSYIYAYTIDPNGNPAAPTALEFATFDGPEGSTFDPVTGDLLVTSWSDSALYEIKGFVGPATLTSVAPTGFAQGSASTTLTLTGTNFIKGSIVYWNGTVLASTTKSSTSITATVPAALLTAPTTASIKVLNPNLEYSAVKTVTVSNSAPSIASVAPSTVSAGGPAFTLAVTETTYDTGDAIIWNGTKLTTAFKSGTTITATVPAASIEVPGIAVVTVSRTSAAKQSAPVGVSIVGPTVAISGTLLTRNATSKVITAVVTLKDTGTVAAQNVYVTGATIGQTPTSSTLPVSIGNIAAGGTAKVTLTFPGTAGATGSLAYLDVIGGYKAGTLNSSAVYTMP